MNVYIINTLSIGEDSIELLSRELNIKGVIGLSDRSPSDSISGFSYQKNYCIINNLNFIEVESYSLKHVTDKNKILKLNIDVLIVCGWQRLIPEWLIVHCKKCVIGSHGSPFGITKGRGRSPQNWSLLMGLKKFEISIFMIDKGIDSGKILDSKVFEYDVHDNIQTSYYKVSILTSNMIINLLSNPNFLDTNFNSQKEDEAEYLPQRIPEDGYIDWNLSNQQIYNFIRSLTKPYPGSKTVLNQNSITIWEGKPFKLDIPIDKYKNGEVFKVFSNGDILVKCHQGLFLITNFTHNGNKFNVNKGDVFLSVNHKVQNKKILDRHITKYPDLPISNYLIDYIYNS